MRDGAFDRAGIGGIDQCGHVRAASGNQDRDARKRHFPGVRHVSDTVRVIRRLRALPPPRPARAARWSATHWKTAVAAWIALVAVAIGLGMTLGTHELSSSEQATGETARAEQILASAGFKTPAAESVLVRSSTRTVADADFRSTSLSQDTLSE